MKTILLFGLLVLSLSFRTLSSAQAANNLIIDGNIATGDAVSEIDDSIWGIYQDQNNIFWFGSNGEGVYRYDGKAIIHFTTKDGLCNNYIWSIQGDTSGNVYFNTRQGISKFDGQTFTTLNPAASSEWKLQPYDLWFNGTQDSGLVYRYDGATLHRLELPKTQLGEAFIAKFPRSQYPNMVYSPYDVYGILKDRSGNIWFGTTCLGACRYDGKSFTWITDSALLESPIRCIYEDKNGNYWFGNSGQAVYHYNGKNIVNLREEKGIGDVEGTLVSYMSIAEDNNGDIWLATYGAGVWRYDGEHVTRYPINDGSTNVTLFFVYKDNHGDLWLGTHNAGVYKFNGTTFEKFRF